MHERDQLCFAGVGRQIVGDRMHANLGAGAALVAHVDLGGRIVADQHHRESGPTHAGGQQAFDAFTHRVLDALGNGLAVD